jgi:hypothetical protein
MNTTASSADRLRAALVLVATLGTIAFNALASAGRVNGVTPAEISDKYPTVITPAGYAFAIWSLIYAGLLVFSILQMLPRRLERYRSIRSAYILSCALNCAWIFFWHSDQIAVCLAIIAFLLGTLIFIVAKVRVLDSAADNWLVKGPFGLYLGWVCAATLVNFAVMLRAAEVDLGSSEIVLGTILVLIAAAFGVLIRVKLINYFAPLAVAWALTAIAVKQSGKSLIVSAAAVGVIACLIAALSFVLKLKGFRDEQR